MTEIERKFLLNSLPDKRILGDGAPIAQGYIFSDQGEMRVRLKGGKYFLTIKSDGTLIRNEWEVEIPQWVFQTIWPKTKGQRIKKTRYSVKYQGFILEIDEYHGHLTGLFTLECEFPSKNDSMNFSLPSWVTEVIEVTSDKRYKNKALAKFQEVPK